MKAYQIKIVVKKTKPPVWRRCMIPAGITFAQLSILLNNIMRLEIRSPYMFEFYQRRIRLWEDNTDTPFQHSWQYDWTDASETYINEYMEREEWFSYSFADGVSYRVTIEKILDISTNAPSVIKYKGICPRETAEYDLEEMNSHLQETYSVTYKNVECKKQEAWYELYDHGEKGLPAKLNPKNDPKKIKKSADSCMREFSETIREYLFTDEKDALQREIDKLQGELEALRKEVSMNSDTSVREKTDIPCRNIQLKEFLSYYSKDDLMHYAKDLNLRRLTSLNKTELAEKISNEILSPSVMKKRLSLLDDSQIELFESLIGKDILVETNVVDMDDLQILEDLDYVVIYQNDTVEVPIDVKETYHRINTPDFQKQRKQIVWMRKCLGVLVNLYGVAPISILWKLYRRNKEVKTTYEELLKIFNRIPEEDNLCAVIGDRVIYKILLRKNWYLEIEKSQGDKEFYIPTKEEIEDHAKHGYFTENDSYKRMRLFLEMDMKLDADYVDEILRNFFKMLGLNGDFHDAMDYINEEGIAFSNEKSVKKFFELVMEVNNNTRMLPNRGHTPLEIATTSKYRMDKMPTVVPMSTNAANLLKESEKELARMGITVDLESNATEMVTTSLPNGMNGQMTSTSKKVYPNDPCPCGSGKKYKKCCGRK